MNKIFAHGAAHPVIFEVDHDKRRKWPRVTLGFGATVACDVDYPVAFYGIDNIKKLHEWLGEEIAKYESAQEEVPDAKA